MTLRQRRVLLAAAGIAAFAVLAPRVETHPGREPAEDPPAEESQVRVRHAGVTLVYDKRAGWVSAKAAEWFPSAVPYVVPADFVADADGALRGRRIEIRAPWWR